MLKQAALPVRTEQFIIESGACLGFVLVVIDRGSLAHELVVSVSKLTLRSVPAKPNLNPVLAHLSFVFSFVHFQLLTCREEWLSVKLQLI
jgi:hypothetical protein